MKRYFACLLVLICYRTEGYARGPLRLSRDTLYISYDTAGMAAFGMQPGYGLADCRLMLSARNNGKDTLRLAAGSPHQMEPPALAPGAAGTVYLCQWAQGAGQMPFGELAKDGHAVTVSYTSVLHEKQSAVWLDIACGHRRWLLWKRRSGRSIR